MEEEFNNLHISVPWWKGNWILILGLYFFTSRQTFYKRKWHEKREILFSPPKSGIPNFSYIFKTVHISEKWLWFSWSAPYFCLRKAGDNWKVALKCKNTQSYLPLIMQKLHFPLRFVIFFVTSFDERFNNLCISVPWWKGNWIMSLGIYFFIPRNTFFLAKCQEKRETPFSHISIGPSRSSRYLLNG